MNKIIEIKNLKIAYAKKQVLKGINLHVEQNQFFGLVGMNGSGKTTMLKAMLDLIAIDGGSITLFDQSHAEVAARGKVAYLPDRFSPPYHLKGREFIEYMLELYGIDNAEDVTAMLKALEFDVEMAGQSINKLSKGMTQKLGLAACLLSNKSLMVLDEPMSGLDPKARHLFKKQLNQKKQTGSSLFFSSHVLADVEELADKMAILHEGELKFVGSVGDFKKAFDSENIEDAYMNCVNA